MTSVSNLFRWFGIGWHVNDHRSPYQVITTFYGVFCHLVKSTEFQLSSLFEVCGSIWWQKFTLTVYYSGLNHMVWSALCVPQMKFIPVDVQTGGCVLQSVPGRFGVLK